MPFWQFYKKSADWLDWPALLVQPLFLPIENDRIWLYRLLQIKYKLKLPSEVTPGNFVIQIQIQAARET